jgi:probable HAF family extracellular repeat protein
MHVASLRLVTTGLLLITALAQATEYQVTDLGALASKKNEGRSFAKALNPSGAGVGSASTSLGGLQKPALFVDGQAVDLLKRAGVEASGSGIAQGINLAQQTTGYFNSSSGQLSAFVEDHGVLSVLAVPGGGVGVAINGAGDVIANSVAAGCACGYLAHAGTLTPLPVPHPERTLRHQANALNDRGWVVGSVTETTAQGERSFAATWREGRVKFLPHGKRFRSAAAWGLNEQGEVVGEAQTRTGDTHAFVFRDGAMAELPGVHGSFSRANAINASGQIVGIRYLSFFSEGFVTIGGTMATLTDLIVQPPGSKWVVSEALGINDAGQIVADAANLTLHRDHRAVLLTPLP